MAAAFLEEALALTADPEADLAGKVAALRAAHRVRADLPARAAACPGLSASSWPPWRPSATMPPPCR